MENLSTTNTVVPPDLSTVQFEPKSLEEDFFSAASYVDHYLSGLYGSEQMEELLVDALKFHYVGVTTNDPQRSYFVTTDREHQFPDGRVFNDRYLKFYNPDGIQFGVARFTPGIMDGIQLKGQGSIQSGQRKVLEVAGPSLVIELIQGIPGVDIRETIKSGSLVDLRTAKDYLSAKNLILDHVLSEAQTLIQSGWKICLHNNGFNKQIREPYFEREPVIAHSNSPAFFNSRNNEFTKNSRFFLLKNPKKCKTLRKLFF